MRVVIHADASTHIGTGHVIRSLALAAALGRLGAHVVLASLNLPASLASRASMVGVEVVGRDHAPPDPDWVVFDGYHLEAAQRDASSSLSALRLVIDDLGHDASDAAIIVDPNLAASAIGHSPVPERLAGPAYALLRPEFSDASPERPQPDVADRVLVTLGGADPNDATRLVVSALTTAVPRPQARIIIGAAHPAPRDIERAAHAAGFESLRDEPSMAPHLAWADLVIAGCGSTALEAARLGRPLLGIILAHNQRRVAAAVAANELGIVVGSHPGITAEDVRGAWTRLRGDRELRARIAAHGPDMVDGRGAERVARAMTTGPLGLRTATSDDAERLLAWRNDRVSRQSSFDPEPIDRQTHARWLRAQLSERARRIWIGELGGRPIGVIRFALERGMATASVALDPTLRGQGVGSRLISAGCARLWATAAPTAITAWVRPDNVASVRAFRHAGFELASSDPDRLMLRLAPEPIG